ncbi:Golgi integral membrane protein 4 [Saguinus oedipus]|uniref:Golgi integral membrane protein 4 n=1 Tax=Saguinus oedipus TaxID=9490 RepID=A0ABQ9U2K7_SAGOE|nr:Golgi integral membrane protein 4 [Saguinus oedipus]
MDEGKDKIRVGILLEDHTIPIGVVPAILGGRDGDVSRGVNRDFLVYKLEAQETLNKGRQDSNSRYSALNVQHQMLKSQHEELKKQHSDLEEEHRKQGEDFSRTFNDHKQKYLQLQQEKEQELSKLKETVYNLREENRQLRKAHQDIHTQLQDVKQQHKNLLSEHEQLVVTLEDHKSALAAAQPTHPPFGRRLMCCWSNYSKEEESTEKEKQDVNQKKTQKHLSGWKRSVPQCIAMAAGMLQCKSEENTKAPLSGWKRSTQVAEYKQLKDTLNRIPSLRKPDPAEQQNVTQVAHSPQGYNTAREKPTGEAQEFFLQSSVIKNGKYGYLSEKVSRNSDVWQNHEAIPGGAEETKLYAPTHKEAEFQAPPEPIQQEVEPREHEEHQVEEEHRKALEEEEMEQVGQAEHLEEEHDPSPEEQDREWKEQREQREAANLLEGHAHAEVQGHPLVLYTSRDSSSYHLSRVEQVYPSAKPIIKFRSPYEEQLEQQRLAVQQAEEAQRLREHQEALHQQRLQGHLLQQWQQQQQQQLAREMALQRQAEREEGQQQHQEQLRQQARYDAMDNDIVQGAEDQGIQEEEGGAYERDNQHQDEAEGNPGNRHEPHEQGPQEANPESEADRAAVEDINPADDPNNQGEDEFEEAEQVREENLPDENEEQKQSNQKQENTEVEEHLVMAGNPDQQEDNVDEQYQEEAEEEVEIAFIVTLHSYNGLVNAVSCSHFITAFCCTDNCNIYESDRN